MAHMQRIALVLALLGGCSFAELEGVDHARPLRQKPTCSTTPVPAIIDGSIMLALAVTAGIVASQPAPAQNGDVIDPGSDPGVRGFGIALLALPYLVSAIYGVHVVYACRDANADYATELQHAPVTP